VNENWVLSPILKQRFYIRFTFYVKYPSQDKRHQTLDLTNQSTFCHLPKKGIGNRESGKADGAGEAEEAEGAEGDGISHRKTAVSSCLLPPAEKKV
jgi:hypothetical protein